MTSLLLISFILAAPIPVAVVPFAAGDGTNEKMLRSLSERVASELRNYPDFRVLSHEDLRAALSQRELEQLSGCDEAACYAEFGDELASDAIVTGIFGRFGSSWLLTLKWIDLKELKVSATTDRRITSGGLDAVLDAIPKAVGLVVEGTYPKRRDAQKKQNNTPRRDGGAELPKDPNLDAYVVWQNDAGQAIVLNEAKAYGNAVYGGEQKRLFEQRVFGGGRSGEDYNFVFWDPRVDAPYKAGFSVKAGLGTLRCGDKKISYKKLAKRAQKTWLKRSKIYGVRWQRSAFRVFRDRLANYYVIDMSRDDKKAKNYRLYVGPRGEMNEVPLKDSIVDNAGEVYTTAHGRLVVDTGEKSASFVVGQAETKLVYLDLYQSAKDIYSSFGIYDGFELGTLCDPYLSVLHKE